MNLALAVIFTFWGGALGQGRRCLRLQTISGGGKLTGDGGGLAVLEGSVLEGQVELLGVDVGEAPVDHLGVGVDDTVKGEAGSLDGVLVHFLLIITFFKY